MLKPVADGVFAHVSEFCQSNAVVVQGPAGALVIDAGVLDSEMGCLARDLSEAGQSVAAGFSTHPHWDHLLWHPALGTPERWSTGLGAETARERLSHGIDSRRLGIPDGVSLGLLGQISGLPEGTVHIPWDGPAVRIVEHQAHAPGHAALVIEERRILVAGDMLSDVLIPMLDLSGTGDPIGDYLSALLLLESVADEVDAVIPGHGSVGAGEQVRARILQDREYVQGLREGRDVRDPRIGPAAPEGWGRVTEVHERQLERLAERGAGR